MFHNIYNWFMRKLKNVFKRTKVYKDTSNEVLVFYKPYIMFQANYPGEYIDYEMIY